MYYYITKTPGTMWLRRYKEKQVNIENGGVTVMEITKQEFDFIKKCLKTKYLLRHSNKEQSFWDCII